MAFKLSTGDLERSDYEVLRQASTLSWDIETTGLDWASSRIATVQVLADEDVFIVQFTATDGSPFRLIRLLNDPMVLKVFHHAPFDLRFMIHHWGAVPASIACTKVAGKIVRPGQSKGSYSLRPSLNKYLGVDLDKAQQLSDWGKSELSPSQLAYAAGDVLHLQALLGQLRSAAARQGRAALLDAAFAHLPVRATLDVMGAGDVFTY